MARAPALVRAGGHAVLAADGRPHALRIVRLEKNAALEVDGSFALAIFCPSSHATLKTTVGSLWLPRRSFLLLEPGGAPLLRNASPAPVFALAFDGALLAREMRLAALWPDQGVLHARAAALLRDQLAGDPSLATLAWVFEQVVHGGEGAAAHEGRNAERTHQVLRRIRHARLYLQANLHTGATVEDIAGVALLSKWYFSRLFQKVYGTSPQAWISEQRVARARHLVINTRLPLYEIAALCGFENPGSMSRAFKSRFGTSARGLRLRTVR
jgi:AraC-like DNA-binding protein